MTESAQDEREPGQHPQIHEQSEPTASPRTEDTNEYADDRATVLQPDGDVAPVAEQQNEGREDAP